MSYTGADIYGMAIAIIDELSDNGTVDNIATSEYYNRAPYLLDMWQKELAKSGDLFKTFEISCYRKQNTLGEFNSFMEVEHTDSDQTYEGTGNCFHFGVNSAATVYVEEFVSGSWQGVSGTYIDEQTGTPAAFTGTINATSTMSFNHYKGIMTVTGSSVRLRFSGDYYYRHVNRALCPYKYQSAADVPDFKPWYKVEMPADFKSRTQVIDEYPMWQYEEDSSHRWERNKDLYIQFGYEGIVRINYIPIPAKITSLTQALEIDDITATSGAYYLAEHFATADQNTELASLCKAKFESLKGESMMNKIQSATKIYDAYGGD